VVDFVNKAIAVTGRVLLGLFVFWQVFFLVTSSFVRVEEPLRKEAVNKWECLKRWFPAYSKGEDDFHKQLTDVQEKVLKRYATGTGQVQHWGLFAPDIGRVFAFPVVEVRWDDDHFVPGSVTTSPRDPVILPGYNEPEDINAFFRYRNFRFRKYETNFMPNPTHGADDKFDPKRWGGRISSSVQDDGKNMAAYLRWRWEMYKELNPDAPVPTQVILHMRGYFIPPPPGPDPWQFVYYGQYRVVRWLPWHIRQSGTDALEQYDPDNDRYESVP
jgi:hypothetical protein